MGSSRFQTFSGCNRPPGFLGDSQFLVSRDYENLHSAVSRTDFPHSVRAFPVSLVVDLDAKGLQALAGVLADYWGVLTDARREDQGIHVAQAGHVGPDIGLDAIGVHCQGHLCSEISCLHPLENLPHVVVATQPLESAFFVQELVQGLEGHALAIGQELEDRRVKVAAAGAHHQPSQGCHAHRRVHAPAALDCRHTGSVSQVERDQVEFGKGPFEEGGGLFRHEGMGGPMKPVAPDLVFLVEFERNGIGYASTGRRW